MKIRIPYETEISFGYTSDKCLTEYQKQEKQILSDKICKLVNVIEIYCKDAHNKKLVSIKKDDVCIVLEFSDDIEVNMKID